jgi:hypothetical protein
MSQVEEQVRSFILEADIPVVVDPAMVDRVERGLRARRRRMTAATSIAAAAAVFGLGAAVATQAGSGDGDQLAADPTQSAHPRADTPSDCSGATISAAGTTTGKSASGGRDLALVLSYAGGAGCTLGRGTRIELTADGTAASATVARESAPVTLAVGDSVGIQLDWDNWCSRTAPRASLTFTDGSQTTFALPNATELPDCTRPDEPSTLAIGRIQTTDVESASIATAPAP